MSELQPGEKFVLTKGQSFIVSDGLSAQHSHSADGAVLLIIDDDLLKA